MNERSNAGRHDRTVADVQRVSKKYLRDETAFKIIVTPEARPVEVKKP